VNAILLNDLDVLCSVLSKAADLAMQARIANGTDRPSDALSNLSRLAGMVLEASTRVGRAARIIENRSGWKAQP
jgi:hypothetical protein